MPRILDNIQTSLLPALREALRRFDFKGMFIEELGWDHLRIQPVRSVHGGVAYTLEQVAQKRPTPGGALAQGQLRERQPGGGAGLRSGC